MKTFIKCFLAGWLIGLLIAGCIDVFSDDVQTEYKSYVVRKGDTLNEIAQMFHEQNTKGYIGLADYQLMVRTTNRDKYNWQRPLQIGDIVKIPVYTVKENKLWK